MTPFCISVGGGCHDTLMLELLLSLTVATVTARGGALGTARELKSNYNFKKVSVLNSIYIILLHNSISPR